MSKGTKVHSVRIDDDLAAKAEAEAKRQGVSVSDVIRDALRKSLGGMATTALLLAAFLGGVGSLVTIDHAVTPDTQSAYNARGLAAFDEMVAEQITDQTKGRDCWKGERKGVIPSTVLVRGMKIGDGAGVVREVSLDAGWKAAKAGQVWILRACA